MALGPVSHETQLGALFGDMPDAIGRPDNAGPFALSDRSVALPERRRQA